jgi:hypothetical protein
MKVKDIINEGISSVVYHGTNLSAAVRIFDENRFKLSVVAGTPAEQDVSKKLYYFSTTRNKTGSYHRDPYASSIVINLDGQKLGQRYSGKPVDYWGYEFRKIEPSKQEMEDRIFHDAPYINNATDYMTEIHIYLNPEELKNRRGYEQVHARKIALAAKTKNIPVYFYDDKKAWTIQNKAKTITPSKELLGKGTQLPTSRVSAFSMKNHLDPYVELYYKDEYDKLSSQAKKVYSNIKYDHFNEAGKSLSADIHNYKSAPEKLKGFMKIWKKEKISSVDEFISMIKNKWERIEP